MKNTKRGCSTCGGNQPTKRIVESFEEFSSRVDGIPSKFDKLRNPHPTQPRIIENPPLYKDENFFGGLYNTHQSNWGHDPHIVEEMVGKTITNVRYSKGMSNYENPHNDYILFGTSEGEYYWFMFDGQPEDDSEIFIESIEGDLSDLIGSPLLQAEEVTNKDGGSRRRGEGGTTWTFYKFATVKGYVTIRWSGSSDSGYYSESVTGVKFTPKG